MAGELSDFAPPKFDTIYTLKHLFCVQINTENNSIFPVSIKKPVIKLITGFFEAPRVGRFRTDVSVFAN